MELVIGSAAWSAANDVSKTAVIGAMVGFMPMRWKYEWVLNRSVSRQLFGSTIVRSLADLDGRTHVIHEVPGKGQRLGQR